MMTRLIRILIVLIPCLVFAQGEQSIAFKNLSVENGLSQNSVVSIAQDSTGYLWFATQDGLNKYDGRSFTYYDLQFDDITRGTFSILGKIYVDKRGQLWVISIEGQLQKFDPSTETFALQTPLKSVSSILQSDTDEYLIGTFGNGLLKINHAGDSLQQVLQLHESKRTIYNLFEAQNGQIYATTHGGYFAVNGSENAFIEIESTTNFSQFAQANDGSLYLGSYGRGLFLKNQVTADFKQFTGFKQYPFPTDLIIQDLLIDSQNRLWVATYGNGAYLIDFAQQTIQNFTENKNDPFNIRYNDILTLFKDNTGVVWLGTDGSGLSYYDEYLIKFNVLTNNHVPKEVNIDVIRAITTDDSNTIWVGTSGKGLTRLQRQRQEYHTYTSQNSDLAGDRIMSLYYHDKTLWIGHQSNGLQSRDQQGHLTTYKETTNFTIWHISLAPNGTFWLGTRDHGLVNFDQQRGILKQFTTENSNLTTNNIRIAVQGANNDLWIGTETAGLFHLDLASERIEKIDHVSSKIKSLYYNAPYLWIGTNGDGLLSYHTKTQALRKYSRVHGLPNNVVYGILPDMKNNLWLSTNKGISNVSLSNDTISSIRNFSDYNGLQDYEFNTGAYFKNSNELLYFGGLKGINWFNPEQLALNPIKPKTIISSFELFDTPKQLIQHQQFKHNENTVTFTFSALHFSQPEQNLFKYRLLHNDESWISADQGNSAHYTNLPPDNYIFEVISCNYDGLWNTEPARFHFTIRKPWYTTHVAFGSYGLLFIAAIGLLYRYLKWRLQIKTTLQLKHEEAKRLRKLDEFKTQLYTNISHEFRTPLTLINGPIEQQLAKPNLSKHDRWELTMIKQNADRLLSLVDQMLDLSMIDSGQIKLAVKQGNLYILLQQIVNAFQYTASKRNIQIKSKINQLKNVWFDQDIIEKITSNLLSNAIKYAPEHSTVYLEANELEGQVVISIINKSEQVKRKDLTKLFQRFYQDDKLSDGVGVGLALVKDLVNLSKGTIIANNLEDERIQFTITLPITKDSFSPDQCNSDPQEALPTPTDEEVLPVSSKVKSSLLIVEDDPELRAFMISTFKQDYKVYSANNGKEGVELAIEQLPDVIISDIMMPIQDGISLCNTLKTSEYTCHIPIILLTAKVGAEHEIEGLQIGADAYVTKPFSVQKLTVRVAKLIENRKKIQAHFSKTLHIDPSISISPVEDEFIKRLQGVLKEHLTNPEFTSDQFGKLMQMSRTQLHRKLKAMTTMSTSEFIRKQRLELAVKLLQTSNGTIAEIAYEVGFNSPSYFNKCFKEMYQCTPNKFLTKQS